MKLILNKSEFEHLAVWSTYNNNNYRHLKNNYWIFEQCDEDYNTYSFYLIENEERIFLGCSQNGFDKNEGNIEIDFKIQYT